MRDSSNISVQEISNVNEALHVLRHFIDLSSRLLPFLGELSQKEKPTEKEHFDRQKIISVYKNYHFDTRTSEILIGSNILELINDTFETLANTTCPRNYQVAQKKLVRFMLEHKRLQDNWDFMNAN